MKRSILILIGCMLFIPIYPQFNDSSFNLPTSNSIILNVDCAFNNSGTLNIDINNAIYGLSVSGYCNLKTDKAYVRILLRDDCNYEHLVYENYVLLADSTHNDFVNIGIET